MSRPLRQEAHWTASSPPCKYVSSDGRPPPRGQARRHRVTEASEGSEATRVRTELLALADEWCRVLVDDSGHARPIVTALLNGRVTITPAAKAQWTLSGEGTLAGLFTPANVRRI